jgi:Na+/proline symporter
MGVLVGAAVLSAEGQQALAAQQGVSVETVNDTLQQDPDRMLPMFILAYLPHGIIGLILVAILSALMSSLDSAINSLSAVTVRDVYEPFVRPGAGEAHYLVVSKWMTALWGAFCMLAALGFLALGESTRQTTIVLINAVGSLLYGPILAAFLLGMTSKRVRSDQVIVGVLCGIIGNVLFWQLTDVSWLWWNALGFLGTWSAAWMLALLSPIPAKPQQQLAQVSASSSGWKLTYGFVAAYFLALILVCRWLETSLGR